MTDLTIGEVARRSGLRPSAIRFYETQGILPAPRRINGRRRYDRDVLQLLRAIDVAKRAGFTVAEMRQFFGEASQNESLSGAWRRFAEVKLQEVDALIARAHEMKRILEEGIRCGCQSWNECVLNTQAEENHTMSADSPSVGNR